MAEITVWLGKSNHVGKEHRDIRTPIYFQYCGQKYTGLIIDDSNGIRLKWNDIFGIPVPLKSKYNTFIKMYYEGDLHEQKKNADAIPA